MFRYSVLVLMLVCGLASAKEMQLSGEGKVSISSGDPQTIRVLALKAAKRNAVIAAINKINGPDSTNDPKVAEKIESIIDQVPDSSIVDSKTQRLGDEYEATITLVLDDKEFRTLLSDAGIATNTTTTRSFSVLAVMDEYFTIPDDKNAPAEVLEEFKSEKGASFKDKSVKARSSGAANASSSSSAASIDARSAASAKESGSHDSRLDASGSAAVNESANSGGDSASYNGTEQGNVSARDNGAYSGQSSAAASLKESSANAQSNASSSKSAAVSAKNVSAEDHDNIYYKNMIKYQPRVTTPEKVSQTYNALVGQMEDYDLKILDNDAFRSKYFKNKPITIQELQNGPELAKYVAFANQEAKADFFMVGTSIIYDSGKNAATGEAICTGMVTVKTYSTVDGESIGNETDAESGAGLNPNDCASNVAKKLASVGGPNIAARIQDYWKRRNTYGREFVLTLIGDNLSLMTRAFFAKAVKSVSGVENDIQRESSGKEYQIVVTYKGSDPLDQSIAMNLATSPLFSSLDSRTTGNQILMCMGPCPAADAQPIATKSVKSKGKKK